MPNWSHNNVCIKGKANNILAFLNNGLFNSGVEKIFNKPEEIPDAIDLLTQEGKHKYYDSKVNNPKIILYKGLTLRTFTPMPDIFLLYDTTNYRDKYPEIAEQQLQEYGAIGWYDYNCSTLGCKWDCDINGLDMISEIPKSINDEVILCFWCDSPWSPIEPWLETINNEFGVQSYIFADEEANFYLYYAEIGGEYFDKADDLDNLLNKYVDEDGILTEEGYDVEIEFKDNIYSDFIDFVKNGSN